MLETIVFSIALCVIALAVRVVKLNDEVKYLCSYDDTETPNVDRCPYCFCINSLVPTYKHHDIHLPPMVGRKCTLCGSVHIDSDYMSELAHFTDKDFLKKEVPSIIASMCVEHELKGEPLRVALEHVHSSINDGNDAYIESVIERVRKSGIDHPEDALYDVIEEDFVDTFVPKEAA